MKENKHFTKKYFLYALTFLMCSCAIPPYKYQEDNLSSYSILKSNFPLSIANSNRCDEARYVKEDDAIESVKILSDKKTWVIVHFLTAKVRLAFLPKQGMYYSAEGSCSSYKCEVRLYLINTNGEKIPESIEQADNIGFC